MHVCARNTLRLWDVITLSFACLYLRTVISKQTAFCVSSRLHRPSAMATRSVVSYFDGRVSIGDEDPSFETQSAEPFGLSDFLGADQKPSQVNAFVCDSSVAIALSNIAVVVIRPRDEHLRKVCSWLFDTHDRFAGTIARSTSPKLTFFIPVAFLKDRKPLAKPWMRAPLAIEVSDTKQRTAAVASKSCNHEVFEIIRLQWPREFVADRCWALLRVLHATSDIPSCMHALFDALGAASGRSIKGEGRVSAWPTFSARLQTAAADNALPDVYLTDSRRVAIALLYYNSVWRTASTQVSLRPRHYDGLLACFMDCVFSGKLFAGPRGKTAHAHILKLTGHARGLIQDLVVRAGWVRHVISEANISSALAVAAEGGPTFVPIAYTLADCIQMGRIVSEPKSASTNVNLECLSRDLTRLGSTMVWTRNQLATELAESFSLSDLAKLSEFVESRTKTADDICALCFVGLDPFTLRRLCGRWAVELGAQVTGSHYWITSVRPDRGNQQTAVLVTHRSFLDAVNLFYEFERRWNTTVSKAAAIPASQPAELLGSLTPLIMRLMHDPTSLAYQVARRVAWRLLDGFCGINKQTAEKVKTTDSVKWGSVWVSTVQKNVSDRYWKKATQTNDHGLVLLATSLYAAEAARLTRKGIPSAIGSTCLLVNKGTIVTPKEVVFSRDLDGVIHTSLNSIPVEDMRIDSADDAGVYSTAHRLGNNALLCQYELEFAARSRSDRAGFAPPPPLEFASSGEPWAIAVRPPRPATVAATAAAAAASAPTTTDGAAFCTSPQYVPPPPSPTHRERTEEEGPYTVIMTDSAALQALRLSASD